MKNLFKAVITLTIILSIGSMTAFAANQNKSALTAEQKAARQEYKQKADVIRSEINVYTTQIKELKEYNAKVNSKVKELNQMYKADKNSVDSDKMKQIKELRKSIQNIEKQEKIVNEDDSVKSLANSGQYDKALERLNQILEAKKAQLKVVQERNAIWHQIDALIG